MTAFEPSQHPRAESGRFAPKGVDEPVQGTETLAVPQVIISEVELRRPFQRDGDGHRLSEWWLERDGQTVAYMKSHLYPDTSSAGARLMLCDIEVREGFRGQGLARQLIEHVEAQTGETMHTTGGFTPLGAAAFAGKMPSPPYEEPGVKYDDMTFVHDWDERIGPR